MKQEIISYISTFEDNLLDLATYLYKNPEESYKEIKASEYITNFLSSQGFTIEKNFVDIKTAFKATYGEGHPKICLICEYDAIKDKGHITGHNLISEISIATALGLKKVIDNIKGSIVLLGCPGEYLGGAKVTFAKQGVFDDVDVVLMAHPYTETHESGTSYAILPLSLSFQSDGGFNYMESSKLNALEGLLFFLDSLNRLAKTFPQEVIINPIIENGGITPLLVPDSTKANLYIRAETTKILEITEAKVKAIASAISSLTSITHSFNLYELPYEELITNATLSRLFCHNLQECGVIDIYEKRDIKAGLSLGTVSHKVPCIHPYVSIIENNSIKYATEEFALTTLSNFAQNQVLKTAKALAFTALDLIEKESLLKEVKDEFYKAKL